MKPNKRDHRDKSRLRSIVVGVAACLVISLGVRADTTTAVPPGLINGIADGADRNLIAHVNAAGELGASDSGTRMRLDLLNLKLMPLSFGEHGLKVDGHVTVDNLPAQQTIAGTVSVSNFPAMQPVAVANFPSTQNVNVVGGMEIAPTSGTVADFEFRLINDGKKEGDWLQAAQTQTCTQTVLNAGGAGTLGNTTTTCTGVNFQTTRFGQLLPNEDHTVTLISLVTNRWLHLTCRHHGQRVLVLETSSPVTKEFMHPLVVDECWLSCDTLEPESLTSTAFACEGRYVLAGP